MQNRSSTYDPTDDKDLVIGSRTWLCLYLFEHQYAIPPCYPIFANNTLVIRLSYGTGRPAILTDDDSIYQCRLLVEHPLSIEDDMRLVSTVELMAIRERVQKQLSPFERPVDQNTFNVLHQARTDFCNWYKTWDQAFSQKYEDAGAFVANWVVMVVKKASSFLSAKFANSAFACRTFPQCNRSSWHQWPG